MNQQELFIKYNGKHLDVDGVYGPQCVDIIKAYFQEVLDVPVFQGNAIDYWTNPPLGFEKISKGLFNRPNPGDIIIWDTDYNQYGHIAVCNWSRFLDLGVFEQNNPVGSPCHFNIHKYNNIIGWLRPTLKPVLPKVPLEIAGVGQNPSFEFFDKVKEYSSNKIDAFPHYYSNSFDPGQGMITQDQAYKIVDQINPREKFVFIFYPPNTTSSFYATYYYPKKDCVITTCPGTDARLLAFEFSHQIQMFFNEHRGSNMPVQIVDSNFPTDELIRSKYDSVSRYYQP